MLVSSFLKYRHIMVSLRDENYIWSIMLFISPNCGKIIDLKISLWINFSKSIELQRGKSHTEARERKECGGWVFFLIGPQGRIIEM